MPDWGVGCVPLSRRLRQAASVASWISLTSFSGLFAEIGRMRIRSAGKGQVYGRVTVTLAKCAG